MHNPQSLLLASAIAALLILPSCGKREADANTEEVDTRRPVHTAILRAEDRVERIRLIGTVEPINDVTFSAEVAGPIAQILKDVGDVVEANEPLIVIGTTTVEYEAAAARGEVAQSEANLAQLQRDLDRAEGLYSDNLAAEDAIDAARTAVDAGRAQLETQRARLNLLEYRIERATTRSPVAGQVVERYVDTGEFVSAGVELLRVVNTGQVKIKTRVNERDIAKIRVGSTVTVTVDAYPNDALTANVTAVANQADTRTRTFPIEITLPNRDRNPLLGGMVARINVPGTRFPNAVLIRQDEIVERDGVRYAYVHKPDGKVEEREIQIGQLFDEYALVEEGLYPGDEMVVRGQFTLVSGEAVRVDKQLTRADTP